jgi:hypothetical protein
MPHTPRKNFCCFIIFIIPAWVGHNYYDFIINLEITLDIN